MWLSEGRFEFSQLFLKWKRMLKRSPENEIVINDSTSVQKFDEQKALLVKILVNFLWFLKVSSNVLGLVSVETVIDRLQVLPW